MTPLGASTPTDSARGGDEPGTPAEPVERQLVQGSGQATGSRPILWISIAWVGMLVAFMVGTPIYQAPDEPNQVDRVLDTAAVAGFEQWDENATSAQVVASIRVLHLTATPKPLTADQAPARPQPNFSELGPQDPNQPHNQLAGHPPGYFMVAATVRTAVASLLPADFWQFDLEVLLLRLISVALLSPLPAITWRTARFLGMNRAGQVASAMFPLCVPQLAHIGSSVNNDNLLVPASSLAVMFGAGILAHGLTWRLSLGAAISAGVAVQAKIMGLVLGPFLALVVIVVLVRQRRGWAQAAAVAAILLASSWTYARNLLMFGEIYPTLLPNGSQLAPPGFAPDPQVFGWTLLNNTISSFWGRFGWLKIPLPEVWVNTLSLLTLLALIATLVRPGVRHLRLLLVPIPIIGALYVYAAYQLHLTTGAYPAQQGRYLFPVISCLALAVGSRFAWIPARVAGLVMGGVALVGFLLSMRLVLSAFWGGQGLGKLSSIQAWSPIGWWAVAALVAAGTAVVVGVVAATLSARTSHAEAEGPPLTAIA